MSRTVLELELTTLYVRTRDGQLERERRSSPTAFFAPPLVAVACGADGLVWACSAALPAPIAAEVARLLRREPAPGPVPEVGWSPTVADDLAALLPEPTARTTAGGPSYVSPIDRPRRPPPADLDLRTSDDTDLADVRPLLPERDAVLDPPWVIAIVDGEAAAVCETARSTEQAVEAGVWTYERFRRRGLAAAVTEAWLEQVGDRTAFYSTSADNEGSQGVARRLGLTPIGQWWNVR